MMKKIQRNFGKKSAAIRSAKNINDSILDITAKKQLLKNTDFKLDVSPDMLMVKDFYWGMKFEDVEITPKQAASKCGIRPSAIDEWFQINEIEEWFFDPPLKLKPQLKAICMMAMRRGMEMLRNDDDRAEKVMKYFIDQATGKAREKNNQFDEVEDDDISDDIEKLDELMDKFNKISSEDNEETTQQ